jgi:hypothetical protein
MTAAIRSGIEKTPAPSDVGAPLFLETQVKNLPPDEELFAESMAKTNLIR